MSLSDHRADRMVERLYKILLAIALLLSATSVFLSSLLFTRLGDTSRTTRGALCTFRADVRERAHNSEQFLKDHPHGIPGISAAALRESIKGQQRTVKALNGINCPPTPF